MTSFDAPTVDPDKVVTYAIEVTCVYCGRSPLFEEFLATPISI